MTIPLKFSVPGLIISRTFSAELLIGYKDNTVTANYNSCTKMCEESVTHQTVSPLASRHMQSQSQWALHSGYHPTECSLASSHDAQCCDYAHVAGPQTTAAWCTCIIEHDKMKIC